VAYVVGQDGAPEVEGLQAHVAASLPSYMVPSAFVVLEAMPLSPNGKLDRKALPAPELGAQSPRAYVAPRTVAEELLAGIWCELLRVERVGVHDDFFALGGHSLLAVQVSTRVRELLRVRLPLAALFQAPTIEELARSVEELTQTAPARHLVRLQSSAGGTPFVVAPHSIGGTVESYMALSVLAGTVRGFDAFESPGWSGDLPCTSVRDMAATYVRELIEARGRRPIHLIGHSFGGLVAYEMHQQLVAAGVEVVSTTLLDTRPPQAPGDELIDPAVEALSNIATWTGASLSDDELARPRQEVFALLAERSPAGAPGRPLDAPTVATYVRVMEAHLRAALSYVAAPVGARIGLVNAADEPGQVERVEGWRRYAPNLEIRTSPGTHQTMLDAPNVGVLHSVLEEIWRSARR
jgi:thioesterase domain-containing protein/acyl carrier protein